MRMTNPQSAITLTEANNTNHPVTGYDRANFNRDVRSITRRNYSSCPADCTEVIFTDGTTFYVIETPDEIDAQRFLGERA